VVGNPSAREATGQMCAKILFFGARAIPLWCALRGPFSGEVLMWHCEIVRRHESGTQVENLGNLGIY